MFILITTVVKTSSSANAGSQAGKRKKEDETEFERLNDTREESDPTGREAEHRVA
jgi:hypothetical protein